MDWAFARERLGAELIGAREKVATRFRQAMREQGSFASALDRCASELVLQAGAALSDGMPGDTPWRRCGGLLIIDVRDRGAELGAELSILWRAMAAQLSQLSLNIDEEQQARLVLGQQLEAALRGAAAEVRAALLDESIDDPALRFGGVKAARWATPELESADRAA